MMTLYSMLMEYDADDIRYAVNAVLMSRTPNERPTGTKVHHSGGQNMQEAQPAATE